MAIDMELWEQYSNAVKKGNEAERESVLCLIEEAEMKRVRDEMQERQNKDGLIDRDCD